MKTKNADTYATCDKNGKITELCRKLLHQLEAADWIGLSNRKYIIKQIAVQKLRGVL